MVPAISVTISQSPGGFGPWRLREMLTFIRLEQKLRRTVEAMERKDAVAGYEELMKDPRPPQMGPSFGTKFLYFAGFGHINNGLQPVILDERVGRALDTFGLYFAYKQWRV